MADIKFTDSQKRAIDFDSGNLLISAAAGSGKTAVLTEKISQLIANKQCTVDELLVVTFTKAAAAEMKSRIKSRLLDIRNAYRLSNHSLFSYLTVQINKLSSSDICTIDSFLYKNVRKYFPTINLSPDTRIASEAEIERLESEAMTQAISKMFAVSDESMSLKWQYFCDIISKTKDTSHIDAELLSIAHTLENNNFDIEKLRADTNSFNSESAIHELCNLVKQIATHYNYAFSRIYSDIELDEVVFKKYHSTLEDDISICEALNNCAESNISFDSLRTTVSSIEFQRLPILKKEFATPASLSYKEIRDSFKKEIQNLKANLLIGDESLLANEQKATLDFFETLYTVLREYFTLLKDKKTSLSLMSYSDLENYACQILSNEKVSEEISSRYKYVFIDEFQDTNETQDYIFSRLSSHSSRFLVGDIKQSIYRFRGADPYVFNNYKNIWATLPEIQSTANNYTLYMSENFRCSKEIIAFTNTVTGKLFANSDITYAQSDELIFSNNSINESHPVEVILLPKQDERFTNTEAEYVAHRISTLIGEYSLDLNRKITASDIAIILRSPSSHGEEFKAALSRRFIKCQLRKSEPLENFQVVKSIVCLLEVINNPLDDVYLAGAMLNTFFDFTVDEIAIINNANADSHLFVSLYSYLSSTSPHPSITTKIQTFIGWLNKYKQISQSTCADVFVQNFLNENSSELLNSTDGDPLENEAFSKFVELIGEADSESISSLPSLLEYIKSEISRNRSSDEAENSSDAVSIISIHSSKGLEFPIVFLCETDRYRSTVDESKPMLFDKEFGFATKISDESGLALKSTFKRDLIANRLAQASSFEEIRMLYVALTRAKNRLIITGKVADAVKKLQKCAALACGIDAYSIANSDNYLDWILMCTANEKSESFSITPIGVLSFISTCNVEHGSNFNKNLFDSSICTDLSDVIDNHSSNNISTSVSIPVKAMAGELSPSYLDKVVINQHFSTDESDTNEAVDFPASLILPKFATGANTYTAAEKGTAIHTFMQFMNIQNLTENGINAEIERMNDERIISRKLADLIDKRQIFIFMHSELYKRMSLATFLKREFRFNINLPAADFTENEELKTQLSNNGDYITVQGVIDCIYRNSDTGKLELIDYKTDGFSVEEFKNHKLAFKKLRERHRNQLMTYKRICEEIFDEAVDKVYIYSTVLGVLIEV